MGLSREIQNSLKKYKKRFLEILGVKINSLSIGSLQKPSLTLEELNCNKMTG
jgi:hypothetical protein